MQLPYNFLEIQHLAKEVQSGSELIHILQDVNLTIKQGDSIAILGASGSGKTTLLTLLAGLDLPTSGQIFFKKQLLNTLSEEERAMLRGKYIGFIFQSFELLPTLTALQNVMLPLEIQYMPHRLAEEKAKEWLEKVGLIERLHHYPTKLSGGEQQRVAIARAFVNQPSLILADEMTGNLDVATGEFIMEILFSLNKKEQTTLVLVTHDERLASRCQRKFILKKGILVPC